MGISWLFNAKAALSHTYLFTQIEAVTLHIRLCAAQPFCWHACELLFSEWIYVDHGGARAKQCKKPVALSVMRSHSSLHAAQPTFMNVHAKWMQAEHDWYAAVA
jgi:hypothetical protein